MHGPDVFGGAINIVTGVTAPASVRLRVGENHLVGFGYRGRSHHALAHPRLDAAWTGGAEPGKDWRAGWALRYRQPEAGGSWMTLDLRLGRRILPKMWMDLEASNVLDCSITEVHGVPLPGRWVSLTISWKGGPR